MNKYSKALVVLMFLFLVAGELLASGAASGTIQSLTIENFGVVRVKFIANHANPDSCVDSQTVMIEATHAAYKELVAFVMVAKLTNVTVWGWVSECLTIGSSSFAKVVAMTY